MTCNCCIKEDNKNQQVIVHTSNFYSLKDLISHNQKLRNSKLCDNFNQSKISLKKKNQSSNANLQRVYTPKPAITPIQNSFHTQPLVQNASVSYAQNPVSFTQCKRAEFPVLKPMLLAPMPMMPQLVIGRPGNNYQNSWAIPPITCFTPVSQQNIKQKEKSNKQLQNGHKNLTPSLDINKQVPISEIQLNEFEFKQQQLQPIIDESKDKQQSCRANKCSSQLSNSKFKHSKSIGKQKKTKSILVPIKRLNSSMMEPTSDEIQSKNNKNNMVQSAKGNIDHVNQIVCKATLSIQNNSSQESEKFSEVIGEERDFIPKEEFKMVNSLTQICNKPPRKFQQKNSLIRKPSKNFQL